VTATPAGPLGTLELALAQALRLLDRDAHLAAEQVEEILKVIPDQPDALALKGLAFGRIGKGDDAIQALRRAVHFKPELPDAWRALADHYNALEMREAADEAFAQHLRYSTSDPKLMAPALALSENRIPDAEALLREHLRHYPTDVAAIRMLAEVAARIGRTADSEVLLARCLELAPGFKVARQNYAMVLHRANKPEAALREVQVLLAEDPTNPGLRNLKAAILGRIGEFEKSIEQYKAVLVDYPKQPRIWMSLGHALKTAGQNAASIDAYRRCIEFTPRFGEVWWSLANLKTYRFSSDDIATMRAQLERSDLTNDDRFHFDFALGKALEDAGEYAESFEHYRRGNSLRRKLIRYDADDNAAHVARSKKLFTPAFFAERRDAGCPAPDPIFVVGLPRSGSTLIEQILATHSQVEGTQELPDVTMIARIIGKRTTRAEGSAYPRALEKYSADELRAFGEQYLAQTRIQRKTDRAFFIDKMPNNFAHVGLIHLMLPNSRIVDARRHPLGCCFSCFKQHFARGQSFTYDLAEIGHYYLNYVELMDHFDAVLPGRVHRVFYENMVEDTEGEIRRLLEYCGLPFEEGVLQFHENQRAVRTASSEQVRRPIFREGVDQWRHYEPWLEPLKQALGSVLEKYPAVPRF
jgi:tetratricopeptide (TPR) repeat protein